MKEIKFIQLAKVESPMVVIVLGRVILVKARQFSNAEFPMLVKEELFANVTVARLVQPLKAEFPMLVTLLGIVMLVRFVQPLKA